MPFTLAHPVIILPLTKAKRFSATALIAGSMAPDFEFFFQLREVENIGHHWWGIWLFDLPVAWLFCYLFHNLLCKLFLGNLPAPLRNRLLPARPLNWNQYAATNKAAVFVSLLVGIASHLLADGFTHYDGMFVAMIPALAQNIGIGGHQIPAYFLLQVGSSLAGMMILGWYLYQMPHRAVHPAPEKQKYYWPALFMLIILVLSVRLAGWPQYNSFWGVFMAVMGSASYSWLLVSIAFKIISFKQQKHEYDH